MAEQKKEDDKEKHIHVIVTFEVKEDKLDAFFEAVKPMIIATNKEKGCIRYNIHQDNKNKCKIVMIEEWDCQENLDNHLKQPHVKTFNDKSKEQEMAAAKPNIFFCGAACIKLE